MSHLTTIIKRVYRHSYKNSLAKNNFFLQAVANLKEHQMYWNDQTELEIYIANKLYEKYSHYLKGSIYEDVLSKST